MTETEKNGKAISDVDAKVIKQIEYYFGDHNLMKDKFMKEKITEDDGWIPLATMLTFNRLKQITEDSNIICEALRKSESGLMEVNEANDKIRRCPSKPLPEDSKERKEEIQARSIYTKRFPKETKLDELEEFFSAYGKVETIYMKRDFHKHFFKGSVFVTFSKKEDAEKFLNEEETKYKDEKLEEKMAKADYFKKKSAERNPDKKKKPDSVSNGGSEKAKEKDKEEEESNTNPEEKAKQQMTANAVIRIEGMDPETMFEEIKELFGKYGEVGYVDMKKGDTEGFVRMKEPNSAGPTIEKARAENDGKIKIHDSELAVSVVEGDAELQYWTKMFKDLAEKQKANRNFRNSQRGGRGRGRGGRGGRGSRGGSRNRDGPQGKRKHGEDAGDAPATKAAKSDS